MKITLPEDISEITLAQYQMYVPLLKIKNKAKQDRAKVSMFTGISQRKLKDVSIKDFEEMNAQIDKAIDQAVEFESRFTMDGQEFAFIPNFDKMTAGEWGDLSKYGTDPETLHNLMAILFRPVTKTDSFKNYDIADYNGTSEYAEKMRQMPMNIVNGALVFFWNLQNELLTAIQKSTKAERKKANRLLTILQSGDGTQPLNG
jgi:hypothetical protein